MIKPEDLDLPEKFKEFRPGQFQLSARIASSPKYAYLLDAPTGVGKSLIAATTQKLAGHNVTYLCTTKQLQDQLMSDFPYARTLKGRANYKCLKNEKAFPLVNADMCTDTKETPCLYKDRCPYLIAKHEALAAPLSVLNIAYYLSEVNYVGSFDERKLVVIDEADCVEEQLMSFIELTVTRRQLDRYKIPIPARKTKYESWVEWAKQSLDILIPIMNQLEEESNKDDWGGVDYKVLRELRYVSRLVAKLKYFVREVDKTWVWYASEDQWTFKPIWVAKYANAALWDHMEKTLCMSATLLDPKQICSNIGITSKIGRFYDYTCIDSPFPPENRPVYYEPCADFTNKNINVALPRIVGKIKQIMEKYPHDKGLIHTVSYDTQHYIMKNIDSDRFMTHSIADRTEILDKFKDAAGPKILLSPSMDRGVDLPGDQCRFVIIAKVPYPYLGDPQISGRVYSSQDGNHWYAHKTISKIIQMAGRGVRSADDYADCVTLPTRILTADLKWKPAGDIQLGDKIISFDEYPVDTGTKHFRYWRVGTVTSMGIQRRPCYTIYLDDGTELSGTANHRWLTRIANSAVWQANKDIEPGLELIKYINVWSTGDTYTHGWLAGFADGEETYTSGLGKRNPDVQHITLSQNPGLIQDLSKENLEKLGFHWGMDNKVGGVHVYINGGIEEKLRFLGEVRPTRLLKKFEESNFSTMLRAMSTTRVIRKEFLGFKEVALIEVDRKTYFAEGYGAHNTYIIDSQFDRLYRDHSRLFLPWFKKAIVR